MRERTSLTLSLCLLAGMTLLLPACESVPLTAPPGTSITLIANPEFVIANGGISVLTAILVPSRQVRSCRTAPKCSSSRTSAASTRAARRAWRRPGQLRVRRPLREGARDRDLGRPGAHHPDHDARHGARWRCCSGLECEIAGPGSRGRRGELRDRGDRRRQRAPGSAWWSRPTRRTSRPDARRCCARPSSTPAATRCRTCRSRSRSTGAVEEARQRRRAPLHELERPGHGHAAHEAPVGSAEDVHRDRDHRERHHRHRDGVRRLSAMRHACIPPARRADARRAGARRDRSAGERPDAEARRRTAARRARGAGAQGRRRGAAAARRPCAATCRTRCWTK